MLAEEAAMYQKCIYKQGGGPSRGPKAGLEYPDPSQYRGLTSDRPRALLSELKH